MTASDISRQRAVQLHLDGKRHGDIADELGVSRRTVQRWLADPEVQAKIQNATDSVIAGLLAEYSADAEDAERFMRGVLNYPAAPVSARLQAARMVTDGFFRLLNYHTFAARLQRLEALRNTAYGESSAS